MKCSKCGKKIGKKLLLRRQFGSTDIDHMALAMYDEFHNDGTHSQRGWVAYEPDDGDSVMADFRAAALAAYEIIRGGRVGGIYGWLDEEDGE